MSSKTATLDGKPVTFREGDDYLAWKVDGQDEQNLIQLKNIVAVLPSENDKSTILVAEKVAVSHTHTESRLLLKALPVTGLPKGTLDRYQLSPTSDWRPPHGEAHPHVERHVVVSRGSGMCTADAVYGNLVWPVLDQLGFEQAKHYQLYETTDATSISWLAREVIFRKANEGVRQSILLLSGDGGIVDMVNGLLEKQRSETYQNPTITLLPLGTGNALANSSGICGDNTLGLRAALLGSPKGLPLFKVTFSPGARLLVDEGRQKQALRKLDDHSVAYGAVVCSWGHHAALVADSDTTEYRKHGSERFKMAAKEALFPSDESAPHAYKGEVSLRRPSQDNWTRIERQEHGYILATFVSQLEAGFTISPHSKPLDGKLRLVDFGALSGEEAMDVMTKAFQGGKHIEEEAVGYQEIEAMRIDFNEDDERWRRICIDGKIIAVEEGGWLELTTDVEPVVGFICRQG